MWVQLTQQRQLEHKGVPTTFYPGDWVQVGRQTAHEWIASGQAVLPQTQRAEVLPDDAGVVLTGKPSAVTRLAKYSELLTVKQGKPSLPWAHTCIWDGKVSVPAAMVVSGLQLLDRWQLAVPILDYARLASNTGTEEDRERMAAVLPDLRVPLYASGLLFVRRCKETQALLDAWLAEPGDRDMAFLRALYTHPLLVLGLPPTWAGRELV